MQLQDKVALVTGAGCGIGRALCREFLRRGASGSVIADLDGALAQETAGELGGLGLQCDVADPQAVAAMVHAAEAHYGRMSCPADLAPRTSSLVPPRSSRELAAPEERQRWSHPSPRPSPR